MGPENEDASVPPYQYVIHRRSASGFYTGREVISDNDLLRLRRDFRDALQKQIALMMQEEESASTH